MHIHTHGKQCIVGQANRRPDMSANRAAQERRKAQKKGIHLAKEERRILYVSFHVREDKASQGEVWNDRDAMQSHRNEPRKKRCTINTAAGLQACCTRHQQFIFSLSISMDGSRGQPKQLVYQDLQPPTEWNETAHNHFLRVLLPGFKAEDIKIRVDDDSRKLKVKGRRRVGQATVERFERDFDVPQDADLERVGGRFQDGWLSVIMPKKKTQETESTQVGISQEEDKKKKEEEPILQEKPESGQHKVVEKPIDGVGIKERHFPMGIPAGGDRKQEEEKAKSRTESGEKPKSCCTNKDGRKEGVSWMKRMKGMEEWVDSQVVDKLVESFNKNRNIIAAAAVGFSIGFYVSLKMRSSSR
ncbi:unnamed protein product [Musa acuminata subsp. burmannicoides]